MKLSGKHFLLITYTTHLPLLLSTFGVKTDKITSLVQIKWAKDTYTIASSHSDHIVRVWNLEEGCCTKTLEGHTQAISSLIQFNLRSGMTCIVSGSCDTLIKMWDLENASCLTTFQGHQAEVCCLMQLNDTTLISGSSDSTIRFWDIKNIYCFRTLEIVYYTILCLTKIEEMIAASSNNEEITFWDYEGKCISALNAGIIAHILLPIQWKYNSTTLVCCGSGVLQKVNVKTKEIKNIPAHQTPIKEAIHLNWEKDDTTVVTLGEDQIIKFWNLSTCKCFKTVSGLKFGCCNLLFSEYWLTKATRNIFLLADEFGKFHLYDIDMNKSMDDFFEEEVKSYLCLKNQKYYLLTSNSTSSSLCLGKFSTIFENLEKFYFLLKEKAKNVYMTTYLRYYISLFISYNRKFIEKKLFIEKKRNEQLLFMTEIEWKRNKSTVAISSQFAKIRIVDILTSTEIRKIDLNIQNHEILQGISYVKWENDDHSLLAVTSGRVALVNIDSRETVAAVYNGVNGMISFFQLASDSFFISSSDDFFEFGLSSMNVRRSFSFERGISCIILLRAEKYCDTNTFVIGYYNGMIAITDTVATTSFRGYDTPVLSLLELVIPKRKTSSFFFSTGCSVIKLWENENHCNNIITYDIDSHSSIHAVAVLSAFPRKYLEIVIYSQGSLIFTRIYINTSN